MSDDDSAVPADAEAKAKENGECFVIAPIDDLGTPTRERTTDLLEHVIEPVVGEELGFKVTVAHKIARPGNITRQVMQLLFEAELVIADLTERNPNVMYELAIRHATMEPVVMIAERDTDLPFDIGAQRTKFYKHALGGVKDFRPKLRRAVEAALDNDYEPDNPISHVQEGFQLREGVQRVIGGREGEKLSDLFEHVLNRFDKLESRITSPSGGRWPATSASPFSAATREEGSLLQIPSPLASERTGELVDRLQREPEILDASYHEDPDGDDWLRIRHSLSTTEAGVKAMVSVHSRQIKEDETDE